MKIRSVFLASITAIVVCILPLAANAQQMVSGHLRTGKAPVYPAEAKARGITGVVTMTGIISKDGHLRELKAVSGPAELRQAAIDAAGAWIYFPYTRNGVPVDTPTRVNVEFNMTRKQKRDAKLAAAQAAAPTPAANPTP